MTHTEARPAAAAAVGTPAANQSGAHLNKDAFAEAKDFLPLDGIDHVEFWVGNARQASAYFRALWGFTPVAFSGLETGVRDRASYVMQQHDIRIVLTAPLTPDGEIAEHVREHGDGVRDIAFAVPGRRRRRCARRRPAAPASAHGAGRARRRRGRRPAPERRLDVRRRAPLASSTAATTTACSRPAIARSRSRPGRRQGLSLLEVDHCVGNVGARRHEHGSSTTTATCSGSRSSSTTTTRSSTPTTAR